MHQENNKQDNSKRYERRRWQEEAFAVGDRRVRQTKDENWHPQRLHPNWEFEGFRCRPSFRAGRRSIPLQGMRRHTFHTHRYDTGAMFEDLHHPHVGREGRVRGVAREDLRQPMHADPIMLLKERKYLRRRILRLKSRLRRINQQLYDRAAA